MRGGDDATELASTRRAIRDRARLAASRSRALGVVDDEGGREDDDDGVDDAARAAGVSVGGSSRARVHARGEDAATMLEIQRAVFEALSAMRETQQRMNGKLSWISRSLPKIYDAVANDVTNAIDDQGDRIEALNERLVKLSASANAASANAAVTTVTTMTTTATAAAAPTRPAEGGEWREDARVAFAGQGPREVKRAPSWSKKLDDHSRSASPSGRGEKSKPTSKVLTRLGYEEIEQEGEEDYAADLPRLGHVGDPSDEKVNGSNLTTAHGKKFEMKNSLGKTAEDPRKWTRKKWLQRLREQTPKIFGVLDDVAVSDMLDGSKCYFVRRGARVVRQGERGSSMFVIVLGKMHVVVTDPLKNRGESLQVATLLPGDFFGEIALMTGDVRRATVMAPYEGDGNVWVLEFSKQDLGSVLLARPNVMRALTDVCADRKLDKI